MSSLFLLWRTTTSQSVTTTHRVLIHHLYIRMRGKDYHGREMLSERSQQIPAIWIGT
jgi:hypothetical protein